MGAFAFFPLPVAIFAPTDSAFAAFPPSLLALATQFPQYLAKVLTYHVVSGALYTGDFSNGESLTTLEMENLTISILSASDIMVDDATIILANITASNGVIQVIDKVLIPPSLLKFLPNSTIGTSPPSSSSSAPNSSATMSPMQSILQIAQSSPLFSKVVQAIYVANLTDVLGGLGPFSKLGFVFLFFLPGFHFFV